MFCHIKIIIARITKFKFRRMEAIFDALRIRGGTKRGIENVNSSYITCFSYKNYFCKNHQVQI